MAPKLDPKFEDLICRSLDGELDDEGQLALNRELLRNPAARRLMEQYQANDALAGGALQLALAPGKRIAPVFSERTETVEPSRRVDWAGLVASPWSAAAAILLAMSVWVAIDRYADHDAAPLAINTGLTAGSGGGGVITGTAQATTGATGGSSKLDTPAAAWPGQVKPMLDGHLADVTESAPLIETPHSGERTVERAFVGVYDEPDNTFYFLEMDREEATYWADEGEL